MFRKTMPLLLILALSLSACTLHIELPLSQETVPMIEDQIALPIPAGASSVDLTFSFGAGTFKLGTGTDSLVAGTARYNVEDLKPVVTANGSQVTIEQGNWRIQGIPDKVKNEWDLKLGNVPMDLVIEAGAYKGELELGGLSLSSLSISDGASDVEVNFSAANNVEMTLLRYKTGASNVSLTGLANANFTSMEFDSGAGNYTLDFSGQLKRDGSVSIETGVSNMTLVIPSGIPVQVTVDSGLSNVSYGSGWEKNGNVYTQEGSGPMLTIVVEMGAGNLTITR